MTTSAPASTLYSQKMISMGPLLIACCKLAPTLARQMWRHNYVMDRNEYLIFTLSESINPWIYLLQFLFKSTNNSWRYERKCEWVFFSEHSVVACVFVYCVLFAYLHFRDFVLNCITYTFDPVNKRHTYIYTYISIGYTVPFTLVLAG